MYILGVRPPSCYILWSRHEIGGHMKDKPRKWWISGLLSIFRPGLGQIYNGQGRKGIIFLVIGIIIIPFLSFKILSGYPSQAPLQAMGMQMSISAIFFLLVISDAIFYSFKQRHHYYLKTYNKFFVYAAVFLCGLLVFALVPSLNVTPGTIKENYMQAYKIPSRSMVPTLLPGDFILVDRRLPARQPARGDVIVFRFPNDETKEFIMRVVAFGGDTVEVQDKMLYVNNIVVNNIPVVYQDPEVAPAASSPRDNFGPVAVPEGAFFVMGDNRDRAFDSKFFGFVDQSKIKGTARQIYWSLDPDVLAFRWERIGQGIF